MPGLSGPDLASRLQPERPALKTLYMSGYTDHSIVRHGGVLAGGVAYLEKPFTVESLARTVREVLEQR